ncbi:polyketide synthase [Cerioporus squamosus]|nr:polyketide synthase [Cerioporus squamosus]
MSHKPSDIAIVGIAAQLPSGNFANDDLDYTSFLDFLMKRGEAYENIPQARFNTQFLRGHSVGKVLTGVGAFLKDVDQFDYMEFGMTARDAQLMPLSTRKLLELSFLSLQDSGIDYRGKNIGCYMAGVAHDIFAVSGHDDAEAKGSFAACSSSLYATHLAVQALRNEECEAAVVGGSQINHRFTEWLTYTQGGILSPDGKCKPFDVSANGFGRGEGVVVIVLKPLEAAIRDHDHIYASAQILGTGVNSSGSLVPANAPAALAQKDAMLRAFRQAAREPQDVDFLELHATGTAQGDPTEANWVGEAFARDDSIVVGSVKGNIGHLEITAFLASLCKVCGIFSSGTIPPNVNLRTPNPAIKWSQYRLRVPLEPEPLRCRSGNGRPLVAMTSSGIGGANGHAVVEGPPEHELIEPFWIEGAEMPVLLVAGALSPRKRLYRGRRPCENCGSSCTLDDMEVLRHHGSRQSGHFSKPIIVPKTRPPIVFVFSGQGTQHFHNTTLTIVLTVGRDLFRSCAPFRQSILKLDAVYAAVVGASLIESTGLFNDSPTLTTDTLGDPWPIAITLPALTMLQLALVDALAAAGVRPDVVVGHSAGETAVLSASGAASKIVALKLSIARGRALSLLEDAKGTMAAVSCSPAQAQTFIAEVNAELGKGVLEIGCYNASGAVTLSGQESHVDLAVAKATAAGIFARKLKTRIPVHSAMMELCRDEFTKQLADVFSDAGPCLPTVPTYSTVTGQLFGRSLDAQYYWDGTLRPVLFQEAAGAILSHYKGATFVEIGPHPVLTSYLRSSSEGCDNITITCPLRRSRTLQPGSETAEFLTALGQVVAAGHNCVDFDALYGSAGTFIGRLPKYPFAPKHVPWYIHTPEIARQRQHRNGPLNYPQLRVNVKTHPELADHVIKGEPIMPASGFIEMALEFGAMELHDVEFHGLLPLSSERPVPLHLELNGTRWSVSSASATDAAQALPMQYIRRHATGFLSMSRTDRDMSKLDIDSIRSGMKPVKTSDLYAGMAHFAQYGPVYRRIQECHTVTRADGTVEALVKLRGRDIDLPNIADYRFHPAIVDAAIHIVVHPVMTGNHDRELYHLPSKVSAFRTCPSVEQQEMPRFLYSHAVITSWAPDSITYDITITDEYGATLCKFERLEVAQHGFSRAAVHKRYDVVYQPTGLVLPLLSEDPLLCSVTVSIPRVLSQPKHDDAPDTHADGAVPVSPSTSSGTADWDNTTQSTDVSSDRGDKRPSLVLDYVRGEEMRLKAPIASLDPREHASLLFIAEDGLNGDAALGFTRSLRKEYPAWTVRVAVFDSSWTPQQRMYSSDVLLWVSEAELEMSVDKNGAVHVPRITPASAPSDRLPFDPKSPWTLHDGDITQTHAPRGHGDRRVVHVSAVHPHHGHVWAFTGTLCGSSQRVVGVTSSPICSHLEVDESSIVELKDDILNAQSSGPSLLAPTITALAVGPTAFLQPSRLRGKRALVYAPPSSSDEDLAREIQSVFSRLGVEVAFLTSLEDVALNPLYVRKPDFIVAGACDRHDMTLLQSLLPSSGHALFWNDADVGVARTDSWVIGDAVRAALEYDRRQQLLQVAYTPVLACLGDIDADTTARLPPLFDPHKAYLLIGGIGSLGLHIALWMYEARKLTRMQHGARHLILTSRSGPESLQSRGDFIGKRILDYLGSREDLVLQARAASATSVKQLEAILQATSVSLGGAIILSALLNDRPFASQTQENFDSVFAPKVDAFMTLTRAVDVASLDFCVTFSSISGMFGNPGQTSYAAANTALAGAIRGYRNAFSIVSPIILDSRILTLTDDSYNTRVRHMIKWGMTARELCGYIGDGIRKLREGPVWQYIPDFDWRLVRDNMGPSQLYDHLIQHEEESTEGSASGKPSLLQIVCKVLDLHETDVNLDVPLTAYGLDSLSASSLSYALRSFVSVSQLQLLADLTIADLQARMESAESDAAQQGASPSQVQSNPSSEREDYVASHIREMQSLLEELSATISHRSLPADAPTKRQGQVVLVTGTTGSLGSHILAELLSASAYDKVIALVRPGRQGSTRDRQAAAFTDRGLDASLLDSQRFVLVDCPFEGEHLGLDSAAYEKLRTSVSHIIHVGWLVNFDLPLSSFKSTLLALRDLVDLAAEALEFGPVSLLYGSSSGIFRDYTDAAPPKEQLLDATIAVGQGYSESKWVAEQLLQVAAERTSVQTTIVRIGQLSGGAGGAWNSSEWLPAMIAASTVLGCLPGGHGPVAWLPVPTAASAIIDCADADAVSHSIVHLRHPRPVSWPDMMAHFSAVLDLPVVDYSTWISNLTTSQAKYAKPGLSLLDFFQSHCTSGDAAGAPVTENNGLSILMDLGETSMRCSTLRNPGLEQLGVEDVLKWVGYWRRTGALPSP